MSIGDISERDAWKFFPRMALYHETDQLAHAAATSPHNDLPEPTLEQKISGDYAKGHLVIAGMPIAIENPQWSVRSGTDADGKEWSVTMQTHYGYFKGTKGADGDEVDVILMPRTEPDFSGNVYVIAQNDPKTGEFDEHKVVLGAVDVDQAIEAYHANYNDDWQGFGSVKAMSMGDFQDWLQGAPDRMMFDGIGGDIRLVTEQDIQADPLAVLDLCVGVLEANTAIVVTGNELGTFPDTEDGKKALRLAAREEFKKMLGDWIDCPSLDSVEGVGAKVEIRNRGIKEFMAFSGDPRKLKLVAAIAQVIKTAKLPSDGWQDNEKKDKKPRVVGYYHLKNTVVVDGDSIDVSVLIEKDDKGLLHYDVIVPKKDVAEFDSVETKKSGLLSPDNYSGGRPDKDIESQVTDPVNSGDFGEDADFVVNMFIGEQDFNGTGNLVKATGITPTGRTNPVKTAKGTKIGTQFAVVEVEKLIISHDSAGNENPAFPQELQPRDRSRDASRAWVAKTANSLDNDSLGRTSRADSGAPIVGRDGIVESGNGRTMAIRMAYDQGTADEYRQFLIDEADYFGIDPDQVEGMKRPVLVRVRTTDIDRRVFTVEANQDDKLALSATERARSDAKRLDANMLALFSPDENGSLLTASNHKFLQAFLASLGDAEAAQYRTSGGKPTRALVDRIRAAVFSKAYNDDRLLEMMADDANPDLQNVLNALGAASSKFIEAQAFGRAAVEDTATSMIDGIEQSLDERVTNAVIEATNTLLSARANNQDVAEYVRQQGLFEDIDDGVAALAVFLAQNSRSAKRMAIAFKAMAEYVKEDAISQANNGLFGEPVPPSLIDVVAAANIQLEQQYGSDARGIGLFDSVNPDIKYITDADTQNDPLSVLDACIDFIANVAKGKKNAAKAIEEDDLSFETVADAMLWVELEAKKQGISVSRFTSTPAYHAIYPKIAALEKKEKEARNANLMARFNDSGLKSGDRVQTTVVGLGGAVADVYTGIVKIVSGKPTVYLNQMMTVSRNGRLHDTKKLTWSNQWQKASDSHGFDSFLADGRYDHIHLDDLQMHPYANAAKERQPTAKTPLLVQKNRRGDLYLIAGVKRYEMALDDDMEYLPAVILPVIEGYGDPVIKRVLNAYTGSIDPLALMAAIEDAVIERAGKKVMFDGIDAPSEQFEPEMNADEPFFEF